MRKGSAKHPRPIEASVRGCDVAVGPLISGKCGRVALKNELLLVLYLCPRFVRIKELFGATKQFRIWTKVSLVNVTMMTNNEGHYSRISISRWKRDQGKAGDHIAIDNVIISSTRSLFALAAQYLEIVPLERILRLSPFEIILCFCDKGAKWTNLHVRFRVPVKTVSLSLATQNFLSVLKHAIVVAIPAGKLLLGGYIRHTYVHGR